MATTAGTPVPLHVDAVSKRFECTVALDGVSFDVRAGHPEAGRIELFGRAFQREGRNRIGHLGAENRVTLP